MLLMYVVKGLLCFATDNFFPCVNKPPLSAGHVLSFH